MNGLNSVDGEQALNVHGLLFRAGNSAIIAIDKDQAVWAVKPLAHLLSESLLHMDADAIRIGEGFNFMVHRR